MGPIREAARDYRVVVNGVYHRTICGIVYVHKACAQDDRYDWLLSDVATYVEIRRGQEVEDLTRELVNHPHFRTALEESVARQRRQAQGEQCATGATRFGTARALSTISARQIKKRCWRLSIIRPCESAYAYVPSNRWSVVWGCCRWQAVIVFKSYEASNPTARPVVGDRA